MPELPEVEVIKRGLQRYLPGRRVTGIGWSKKKLRLSVPRRNLQKYIQGATITSVDRRAKFLLVTMNNGAKLIFHLGMTGRLGIFPAGAPRAKHDHLLLLLDNATEIRFNDIRRFGFIQVLEPDCNFMGTMLANLGPEPFDKNFTPQYLQKLAAGKQKPLKNFLMDNRVVVGVGNIYACETLYHARLHPERKVSGLSIREWARIVESCRNVLQKAIASGGTTISDFVNESGKSGYFQLELRAYGREGQACKKCSAPIARKSLAGRSTFFCPDCQK